MQQLIITAALALGLFTSSAQAQKSKPQAQPLPAKKARPADSDTSKSNRNRVPINSRNSVRINFNSKTWNKDTKATDSGTILMREGASGRLVQISLSETGADTGVFTGLYQISWQNIERLQVEFYLPPQEILQSRSALSSFMTRINKQEVYRSPFILRRSATGEQIAEVFETREEALIAMETHRRSIQQRVQQLTAGPKLIPTNQEIDVAKMAADARERDSMAIAAEERARMEQLEAQKLAELQSQKAAMSEAEKQKRIKEAADLAAQGMEHYRADRFQEAVAAFDRAVELDPSNKNYYFQYGVTLYKIEDFNKSIVYLRMADGSGVNPVERSYFIGLNFFRKKEQDSAIKSFDEVTLSKHPDMSPSAAFYRGMIRFEQQKWEEAQSDFQMVLDTSKDPQLDKRAESYIEQILRLRQFEEERKRKWMFSVTLGEMYDSNVTLSSDSSLSQGSATNVAGYRTLFTGSGRYRPVYDEKNEFALQLDLTNMYTLDTSLQTKQNLTNADPLVMTATAPWTHKATLFGKGYKLDLIPGIESIWMSPEDNTNKEIIQSYLFTVSNMFVMRENLFSNFNAEVRQDQSKLRSSVGDDDASAMKVKLINSNILFLTEDKSRIATGDVAYTINQAKGKNSLYDRIDLGVGYIRPWKWETTVNFKLGYFILNYPQNNGRTDNSVTLTSGGSRKLTEKISTGALLSYNINNSTLENYRYSKWTAMLTLSAQTAF